MAYEDLLAPGRKPWATLYLNAVQLQAGATIGDVLTCTDAFGSAAWAPAPAPPPAPSQFSCGAHWGDSAASLSLPASNTTPLPIDTIDSNPGGVWSIVGNTLHTTRAGTYSITVSANMQNVSVSGNSFATLIVAIGATTIAQQYIALTGSSNNIGVVTTSIMKQLAAGDAIAATIETHTDDYEVIGNAIGGAPIHPSISYSIACVA